MNEKIIRPTQLADLLGVDKATVSRLMSAGTLPKIQITKRAVGVLQSDFDAYLKNARVNPPVNVE